MLKNRDVKKKFKKSSNMMKNYDGGNGKLRWR